MSEKQMFYSELITYAENRGFKKGWAYYAYKDKFGVAPDNSLSPFPADFVSYGTSSWIKHRNIAKAKAREKATGVKFNSRPATGWAFKP